MMFIKPLLVNKLTNLVQKSTKIKQVKNFQLSSISDEFSNLNYEPRIKYKTSLSIDRIKNLLATYSEKFKIKFVNKPYDKVEVLDEVKQLCKCLNIKEVVTEANFLGKGANGRVYKIPNSSYAIKIPTDYIPNFKEDVVLNGLRKFNRDKVNFIEAICGPTKILKYVDGIPIKNVYSKVACENNEISSKIAKCINNLSDSSIKKYYLQILEAKRLGLGHDFIGNNCILNAAKGDITAIDFDIGRKTYFLESLIFQCGAPNLLSKSEQNNLIKKGLKNLLEMIQDGKILANEVNLSKQTLLENSKLINFKINDPNYFNYICQLCDEFSKNKTFENINNILSRL